MKVEIEIRHWETLDVYVKESDFENNFDEIIKKYEDKGWVFQTDDNSPGKYDVCLQFMKYHKSKPTTFNPTTKK